MIAKEIPQPRRILDLCCGTGAMMNLLCGKFPNAKITGGDFAVNMLKIIDKNKKFTNAAADAMFLPFKSSCFDVLSCTFGLRNFQSLEKGLGEIYRVIKPEGIVAVLEFQKPGKKIFGFLFNIYFTRILPIIGALVGKDSGSRAYEYLPSSVRSWHDCEFMIKLMHQTGFKDVRVRELCFGAVLAITAKR